MRHVLTMVTVAMLSSGLASLGTAGDPTTPAAKAPSKAAAGADVRADIHRTLAALIQARSAEKPDTAKVDELARKLEQLRGKLRGQSGAIAGNAGGPGRCPWGGPGVGYGRGMGAGYGRGPGAGRGMGWNGGGGGMGRGAGLGRDPGGAAFVDRDGDGVCDNYELRHGTRQ
jgi:hypothetical protein